MYLPTGGRAGAVQAKSSVARKNEVEVGRYDSRFILGADISDRTLHYLLSGQTTVSTRGVGLGLSVM